MKQRKQRPVLERAYRLEDLSVGGADGRTVTAYAAMFDAPYEVIDHQGHYFESIHRTAFNRTLSRGLDRTACLFNHGTTVHGTPSDRFSLPLGNIEDVTVEERGLLTVTRYSPTELADEVLTLINDGAIRGMSFRGGIFADRQAGYVEQLPLIERTELGLLDFGPATFAMNPAEMIVSVRSVADTTNTELEAALTAAISDRFAPEGSSIYTWVVEYSLDDSDLWVIYAIGEHFYRLAYTVDPDGNVTLDQAAAVEVDREVTWIETPPPASTTRSTPPVTPHPDTPLADPGTGPVDLLALEQQQRRRRLGVG